MFSIVLYFFFTVLLTKTVEDQLTKSAHFPCHLNTELMSMRTAKFVRCSHWHLVLCSPVSRVSHPDLFHALNAERELGDQNQRKRETDLSTESQKTHSTELSEYSRPEKMCSKVISTEMLETDLLTLFS